MCVCQVMRQVGGIGWDALGSNEETRRIDRRREADARLTANGSVNGEWLESTDLVRWYCCARAIRGLGLDDGLLEVSIIDRNGLYRVM